MFRAFYKLATIIVLGGAAIGTGVSTTPVWSADQVSSGAVPVECELCKIDPHHSMIPDGWKVSITSHPLNPKQSTYIYTATVQDQQGNGANHAKVYLRVHTMDVHRVHSIRMENSGNGTYWVPARVHTGDPSEVAIIIQP